MIVVEDRLGTEADRTVRKVLLKAEDVMMNVVVNPQR